MEVRLKEPMSCHTSFRTGGPADWFIIPDTPEELAAVISVCRRLDASWCVIGNGTNLLAGDLGYRGAIISMERFQKLEICGNRVSAGAGLLLSRLANGACKEGLAGMEFAAGIPGTVGGAVVMNAGAYGGEISRILESVTVLDEGGRLSKRQAEELELGYRTSRFQRTGEIVLEAEFLLVPGAQDEIRARMEELAKRRKEKQPLEYPSAGSTFKRPEGYFAGQLIEKAGLKGFCLGGAAVSEKHAGFVINKENATSADILALCEEVRRRVKENSGQDLELEVRLLGEFRKQESSR
ncbi:MAG TPA: UDP-N-acetylmuramate dehydrogenase [Candidatus Copromonas faecavium]|uniref:UDP-N-acetylenolpyruvoylglucosamine reductase n=1 Tax=Candidatus Copromonas faecavium (nom. illeg.) TaxID=2840740 RepID=A0A9D1A3U9_9FIRM|nr:UDP-N-acetylmuramate dehydrogenase [Candidatus Copromonas faecavium]